MADVTILLTIILIALIGAVVAGLFTWLRAPRPIPIDPFSISEPWRQFVQGAIRSTTKLAQTIEGADDGPLRERMETVAGRLDDGLNETWQIAQRGDDIDDTITRLDPPALRAKLEALELRAESTPTPDIDAAVESVQNQLESVRRLELESKKTSDRLRLTQTRLDELVSRAAEVVVGAGDTDAYEHDVDDLVVELEALRQAIAETNRL